jgi:HSP20 family protein
MAEGAGKPPAKGEKAERMVPTAWHPLDSLQRELDRLFDDFGGGWFRMPRSRLFDLEPAVTRGNGWGTVPAVDVVEKDKAYEITAELPGIDEKNVDINVANGMLTIRGEKSEEKEDKRKDYYVSERRFGSFERAFALPEGVDVDKIDASFKKGVLTITLPKLREAQQPAKKIAVKSA